jgi:small subunit ribosomal protein S14
MAKTCMTEREIKRRATVSKFAAKRAALEAAMNDVNATAESRLEARMKRAWKRLRLLLFGR